MERGASLNKESDFEKVEVNQSDEINGKVADDQICSEDLIVNLERNQFQLTITAPIKSHLRIMGGKGKRKKQLENETTTKVKVPSKGSNDTRITIKGNCQDDVLAAKERLELMINASVPAKQKFTHFISIAFTADEIKENFVRFRNEILADEESYGIDKSLFYKPEKLHLTFVMLSLLDEQDENSALESLKNCKETIIDPMMQGKPLTVTVKGVDVMNENPSSANIVFAKVASDELQAIADGIAQNFPNHETRGSSVKLHVTLINTSKSRKRRRKFDATKILEKYDNFEFGTMLIDEIHISQLIATAPNGFYGSSGIIKL